MGSRNERVPKLDTEAQQNFNAKADAVNREINPNIHPQIFASNEIIESRISEKIKELQDEQKTILLSKLSQN